MRRATVVALSAVVLLSLPALALAQPAAGGTLTPAEIPAALSFETVRTATRVNGRGERIEISHTRQPFPASALRIKKKMLAHETFGGGSRLVGWSHQYQGDKWWFVVQTPEGARYTLCVEGDSAGMTKLSLNTHAHFGPEVRARRTYRRDDLGPRP